TPSSASPRASAPTAAVTRTATRSDPPGGTAFATASGAVATNALAARRSAVLRSTLADAPLRRAAASVAGRAATAHATTWLAQGDHWHWRLTTADTGIPAVAEAPIRPAVATVAASEGWT